ncbi:uncharacterized protein PITG_09239 [Phytophthora infestans T30-4]|uniref:Integrase catalytic domain-containing protein n=1 Tax=Phytophthora infestans (strain T30-4) TaxID=403677 RepID=D0NB76_PHYIT|nr:uncharacterized protein PITG_09239 [Phytophthora infestans T30-4]EEY55305.1 hypothetical protein PITG_09239 [Phytophthora infestans T30-4]|eukprot:XP_002903529.1 hypothetical protein PITG_09239 [Phytophthora infestans T30-4]
MALRLPAQTTSGALFRASLLSDVHILGLHELTHNLSSSIPILLTGAPRKQLRLSTVIEMLERAPHARQDDQTPVLGQWREIKYEKTLPFTHQQSGLAERMNQSLNQKKQLSTIFHESIDNKWLAKTVNTAAWITNRVPPL